MSAEERERSDAILVEKTVTINRPAEALFHFWRKLDNLPQIMSHLESVAIIDSKRSHWIARRPSRMEWDSEIITEIPGRQLNWRSVDPSEVETKGSVFFSESPGNRGTEVKVILYYNPPAGRLGAAFAKLFGEAPDQMVREDLRKFKQVMEAGEVPTIKGQPSGEG